MGRGVADANPVSATVYVDFTKIGKVPNWKFCSNVSFKYMIARLLYWHVASVVHELNIQDVAVFKIYSISLYYFMVYN